MKTGNFLFFLTLFVSTFSGLSKASAAVLHPQDVREIFVEADQAQLFCRVVGKGRPLVVLHGGPGLTQDYLLPQLYKLGEANLVIFYDQRGCGRSTGEINADTITMEAFVNDLEAIRQAFKFDKISVLGHSWGGFLAMQYAIAYPEKVEKLILSNSMAASADEFSLFIQEYIRRTAPYQAELKEIQSAPPFSEGDPELVERNYRLIFRAYCYLPAKAELLNLRMPASASVNGTKVYENLRRNVFTQPFDLHGALKGLNVPTLIIHGDADPVPASTAQHVHASISHSKYLLMKNCGHFPYVEDPETYLSHLKDFLRP